jgi:hypothetical protein
VSLYLTIGRRRLGKTTLDKWMSQRCTYRFVIDPRRQLDSDGALLVTTPEELDHWMAVIDEQIATELAEQKTHHTIEVLIQPTIGETQRLFEHVAIHVQSFMDRTPPGTSIVLVVDEAQFFDLLASASFEFIVRASPPHVNVMLAAHRPADIPTGVRALSDTWLIFRTSQEHDLKAIRERCGAAVATRVQHLEPRQFIEWDDGAGESREHLDPRVWFVPLVTVTGNQPEMRLISGGVPTRKTTVDSPSLFDTE